MRYPALLPADQVIAELDTFDSIIDVRSPAEFALDHMPGAINCPVLNDTERVSVGTLYKQQSPFEARKLGAAIVARSIAHHLEQHFQAMPKQWKPLIYCWRGGNRSGSMALIFAKVGWPVVQLDGGYKAYRHGVMQVLEQLPLSLQFRVICGTTGSGKSRLLNFLSQAGAQVLDLEQLAAHRGSVLGGLPLNPQPSQKMFETRLWQALRGFTPDRVVYVESESKKIGDLRVPGALMDRIRSSPCVQVQISTNDRVKLLIEDYPHLVKDTELLTAQLSHLTQLHGKEKIQRWQALAENGEVASLVEALLLEHYDPAYLRSIEKNFAGYLNSRVVPMTGIEDADFLAAAQTLIVQE
ncbi:MAG: tRNA 2-selenouridine(34) synthase MnmH [Oxalobacteraceae bacterium]|nr:tRNA 2-selenouridine(34) synthase MnmH [Oxalobacteraceae bacterium]